MSPKLFLILAVILTYAGVFFIFRKGTVSLLVGMEYLLLGFLCSLLPVENALLKPLLYAFLGWIGLLTGAQFKINYMLRLEAAFYRNVLLYSLMLFTMVFLVMALLLDTAHAAVSAIALLPISYRTVAQFVRGNRYPLFFVSTLPFVSIAALLIVYGFLSPLRCSVLLPMFIAGYCIISRFILTHIDTKRSINLLLIGLIIFISESCAALAISPLIVTFFVGMYLANFCPLDSIIFTTLYRDEKPLYILFLLLTGMIAGFQTEVTTVLYSIYLVLAVLVLKYILLKLPFFKLDSHPWFYFIAPGGFSITIAVDFWLSDGGLQETTWFSLLLAGVLMLQLFSVYTSKLYEK